MNIVLRHDLCLQSNGLSLPQFVRCSQPCAPLPHAAPPHHQPKLKQNPSNRDRNVLLPNNSSVVA
jgi:hypothetical protein